MLPVERNAEGRVFVKQIPGIRRSHHRGLIMSGMPSLGTSPHTISSSHIREFTPLLMKSDCIGQSLDVTSESWGLLYR